MVKSYQSYVDGVSFLLRSDFTTIYAYHKGKVVFSGTLTEWNETENKNEAFTIEKIFDEKEYKKERAIFDTKLRKACEKWKEDIFKEAGAIIGNKQHEALWNRIYSDYHSIADEVPNKFIEYFEDIFNS